MTLDEKLKKFLPLSRPTSTQKTLTEKNHLRRQAKERKTVFACIFNQVTDTTANARIG